VACLLAFAHGGALRKNNENTRELVQMLEKLLNKISKKQVDDTTSAPQVIDPFEEIYSYLQLNAADILDKPVNQVPEDRIASLLDGVSEILDRHVDPAMESTVGLRFFSAFFEHVIYEGTEKIWEIADSISREVEELREMSEGASEKRERSKRSLADRRMQAKELAMTARSAKDMSLSKKFFEEHAPKIDTRQLQDSSTSESGSESSEDDDFSGYQYCHFSAIWEHIAGPAYAAVWGIRNVTQGFDYNYYGNIFYSLEYGAESGILQAPVEHAIYAYAYEMATVMYTPPAEYPTNETWARIIPIMMAVVEKMENFDATSVPEVSLLSDDQAAIFAQVYLAVGPLIQEAAVPLRHLLDAILNDDEAGIEATISSYIVRIFEKQLYILANLGDILRQKLPEKADAMATIYRALKEGKQDDVFVALFAEIAEGAMASGQRLENLIWWFDSILDHVAFAVDTPKGDGAGVDAAIGKGRKGDRTRFLNMVQG